MAMPPLQQQLQSLYEQLGSMQAVIQGGDFAGTIGQTDPEQLQKAGISHFISISDMLQKQFCDKDAELNKLATDNGLTVGTVKTWVAELVGAVFKISADSTPAGIIAGIVVGLFFDVAAPKICQAWQQWNQKRDGRPAAALTLSAHLPHQSNLLPAVYAHH